ncbi:MAG: TldD/PmbA family protein [Actinomycetota bacterium]
MTEPVGANEFRAVADAALEIPGADGVEVLLVHEWGGLTRFAKSSIHQSTWREDTGIRVRVVSGSRIGVAATNEFTKDGARRAAESAREMAQVATEDFDFPDLAPPAPTVEAKAFDAETAGATPEARADGVARVIAQCRDGFHAAGACETTAVEVGLANTEGQFCLEPYTQASVTTVVSGKDGGAGFAETFAKRFGEIDFETIGRRAWSKADRSREPRDIDAGVYEVVLEPSAVSTLTGFLAYLGFGGRMLIEDRSCFSGKQNEQVAAQAISLTDDAFHPATIGLPFDFEGTPRRQVGLIKDGVFIDAVYDRRSAKQAGKQSTGHALPPPNPEGPFPLNLSMSPGGASLEDMVAATERGLLVTRFHYSNIVHPKEAVITGMTRDGTFLIEDGEVRHPVKNLRFTQSIPDALSAVQIVGKDLELASEFFFSSSIVPALKIERFRFTSKSDH